MNMWAIIVSAIVSMIIGGLWYSPMLFGKIWMKLSGINPGKSKSNMTSLYIAQIIIVLVEAFVIGFFTNMLGLFTFWQGLFMGFLIWLGFVATLTLGQLTWEGKPLKLWLISNAYNLLTLLLMSGIIAAWQ